MTHNDAATTVLARAAARLGAGINRRSARHLSILLLLAPWVVNAQSLHEPQSTTVVSWNIRYDNPLDSLDPWALRQEAIAREVLRQRPHIVGLQEVLAHQATYLDQQWPGYRRFGVGRDDGMERGEFSPVYFDTTTYALIEGRTVWLSETPEQPSKGWDAACERIATLVILRSKQTGDSLWVVNTHWDHVGKEARLNSARLVHKLLAPVLAKGAHVLLLGDLNATPDQPAALALGRFFKDCCPRTYTAKGTYNAFDTTRTSFDRIDYVWTSQRNCEVLRYETPHVMSGQRFASDHFPVVVGLRWR